VPWIVPEFVIVLMPVPVKLIASLPATLIDPPPATVTVSPPVTVQFTVIFGGTFAGHGAAIATDACSPAPATAIALAKIFRCQFGRTELTI
jgi:hypothetical protein